ncbi:MAG: hypothetical protein ACRDJH_06670 [Thermomicrobiales bacterium]
MAKFPVDAANDAYRHRLELALQIAPAYAAHPRVVAVAVGGSVARGHADRFSDLELAIFWSVAPSSQQRTSAARRAGAVHRRDFQFDRASQSWEEDYEVAGLKIDVRHITVASTEWLLADVADRFDVALSKQVFAGSICHSIPLAGHKTIERWRARAEYPGGLAQAMVQANLGFGPKSYLAMLAARDDCLLLYDLFCRIERLVLGMLLGLNRVYPPSADFKWLDWTIRRLPIAPPDLAGRLRRPYAIPPPLAVEELGRLIDETLTLVEFHLPEVDTAPTRARIAQRRPVWVPPSSDESTLHCPTTERYSPRSPGQAMR